MFEFTDFMTLQIFKRSGEDWLIASSWSYERVHGGKFVGRDRVRRSVCHLAGWLLAETRKYRGRYNVGEGLGVGGIAVALAVKKRAR